MHVRRYLLATLVLTAFTLTPAAHGFVVGVTENDLGHDATAQAEARAMRLGAVRVFVFWSGETQPSEGALTLVRGAQSTGARVFVNITGDFRSGVVADTLEARTAYVMFAQSLAAETGVQDIEVWNEPNLDGFWSGTPTDYAHLLAAAYDGLTPAGVRTWAFSLERRVDVIHWITTVASTYKAMRRTTPLFHGVAHHPYPVAGEKWDQRHPGTSTFAVGDTARLLKLLDGTFARTPQCPKLRKKRCAFPLIYTETGWPNTTPTHIGTYGQDEQARIFGEVASWLFCRFTRVEGLLVFELLDGDWTTGAFTRDGTRKPLADVLANPSVC